MSTLSTYKTILSRKLATSSENYYDEDSREQAINDACRQFTDEYKPLELKKKANVTIAADGDGYYTGTVPTDLSTPNRMVKFWVKASKRVFVYVDPEEFYHLSGDVWTIDYSVAGAALKIFVAATDVTTLEAHYIKDPATMTADANDSGLTAKSDELIALYAAEKLFQEARDTDGMVIVESMKKKAVRAWHNQYGLTSSRLKSKFERTGFHSRV